MKFHSKNLRIPKVMKDCMIKCKQIKNYVSNCFEHSELGSFLISLLVSGSIIIGMLSSYFPSVPLILIIILSIAGFGLLGEVLGLIVRIVFGLRKRNRIYGFLLFLSIAICTLVASQAQNAGSFLIFSVITTLTLCLFGRSCWAMFKNRKYTALGITCLSVTTALLIVITVLLSGDGFTQSFVSDDLMLAEQKLKQRESVNTQSAGQISKELGSCEVSSLLYGTDSEAAMISKTVDLTAFAERSFPTEASMNRYFGYDMSNVPLSGKIWYPVNETNCPVLFIIHGNHVFTTDSYLGYDYLGEYLASYGYVVVSVNEKSCNDLMNENDGRAVLLLENMKYLLAANQQKESPIYHKMNEDQIAIAGHSRGGEAVSEAYLFNGYDSYPDDGTIPFEFHFNIKSVIAIAPTIDMYQPAQHEVSLVDVNYLLLQGANDHDTITAMGEKQYNNVTFTGDGKYQKSMLYIAGANHGQFNTLWGRYDFGFPIKPFLNVASLIPENDQQTILKLYVKTFLDVTLKDDKTNEVLLKDYTQYASVLPKTVYQQTYQTSQYLCLSDFSEDSNLNTATMKDASIQTNNLKEWREVRRVFGSNQAGENYVLQAAWDNTSQAQIVFTLPSIDLTEKNIMFDLADNNEDIDNSNLFLLDGTVTLTDAAGNTVSARISDFTIIYPTLPVQLRKLDYVFGDYEYKHQFQTVSIPSKAFQAQSEPADLSKIVSLSITFDYSQSGSIQLDHVGFE